MSPEEPEAGGYPEPATPAREPALRSPWPPLLIVVAIIGLYALQSATGAVDAQADRFGFSRAHMDEGRWGGLVTALFVHGGWGHAILNALGALAFGAPVARLFGGGAAGSITFFLFYLLCGALSSLGFIAVHGDAHAVLVGASGAVAGLMGAASRLMWQGPGLAPFTSSPVVSMAAAWIVINLVVGLFGLVLVGDAPIAWEAHLAGYAAGLVLVAPFAKALRRI